jgi:hypothetical protein
VRPPCSFGFTQPQGPTLWSVGDPPGTLPDEHAGDEQSVPGDQLAQEQFVVAGYPVALIESPNGLEQLSPVEGGRMRDRHPGTEIRPHAGPRFAVTTKNRSIASDGVEFSVHHPNARVRL